MLYLLFVCVRVNLNSCGRIWIKYSRSTVDGKWKNPVDFFALSPTSNSKFSMPLRSYRLFDQLWHHNPPSVGEGFYRQYDTTTLNLSVADEVMRSRRYAP